MYVYEGDHEDGDEVLIGLKKRSRCVHGCCKKCNVM